MRVFKLSRPNLSYALSFSPFKFMRYLTSPQGILTPIDPEFGQEFA